MCLSKHNCVLFKTQKQYAYLPTRYKVHIFFELTLAPLYLKRLSFDLTL